jgi:hypothetical protein
LPERRFPPPWSVDEADSKLDMRSFTQTCRRQYAAVEGLEADVSVILDAADLDARNLYVAMTRRSGWSWRDERDFKPN